MSAVDPPQPKVTPNIPKELITSGKLSNAQLETIVYAIQAHESHLPAGPGEVRFRRGHMNGDGTGVGKGRQNAAVIMHNFNEGRRKAVWLSLKANLIDDAARDWTALGMSKKDLHPFQALKRKKPPEDGVLFVTYDTLRAGGKKADSKSNLQTLLDWLGPDFDGAVIMDEAHAMGNAMPTIGASGRKKNASQRAAAGVALQEKLPEARIEYASATGADYPKIYRIRTDDGQTVVGRHITKKQLPELLRNLGAGGAEGAAKVPPHETIHAHLSAGRGDVTLANGWRIRPVRVGGEKRIELFGPNYAHERELMNDGVVKEKIRNDPRLFIPVGRAGVEVLRRITASRPIAEVGGMDAGDE
jgi:hypothetical protein